MVKYIVRISDSCNYHPEEWKILESNETPRVGTSGKSKCDRDKGAYSTYPACQSCNHEVRVWIESVEEFSEERAKELRVPQFIHSSLDGMLVF